MAHQSQQEKDTGHFRLTLTPGDGGTPQVMDFTHGQTETWLAPPAGGYALQLDFVDNLNPGNTLAPAASGTASAADRVREAPSASTPE